MSRLTIIFIFACFMATGQNLSELERRSGFKDIRLATPIDSVKGYILEKEFKERNEFPAKLYKVENEAYNSIGEVKVSRVELKTYKDTIYEIGVWANKDPRLMKALESLYGRADYDMKNDTYFWKTDNIVLKFRSEGKNKLVLTYISPPVHKSMKADKDKKVDDIANDF
jgi:adenylate cyclase class IV